jgi:hypothetical protein
MPFETPDSLAWSGPTSSGLIFRNGSEFAAAFAAAWRARSAEENAARMARKARHAALGSLEEQAAGLAAEAANHPALAKLYGQTSGARKAVAA